MDAKRGYVPEDDRNFSPEAIEILKTASRQIFYLLNEGYDLKSATVFVGNHFLLSERQRLAVMRSLASREQLVAREQKEVPVRELLVAQGQKEAAARELQEVPPPKLQGREVWIDGFNTIISLEVMLCGSPLFVGMDGAVRDLAALRGTYRLIPETAEAVRMMLYVLREAGVGTVHILLDEPVSNSGRLKALIADIAEADGFSKPEIQVLPGVDRALYDKECVISSDSIILDHCRSWVNLGAECLRRCGRTGIRVWE